MRALVLILLFAMSFSVWAQDSSSCTLEVPIVGPIGAGTLDILERVQDRADVLECGSILLLIDTPGGSVDSTRKIVTNILNSKIPVLCLVYPDGSHAGSAGAIILQACHVNGAMTGTNLGAATPILGTGETVPEDLRNKMINDMTSWMDSLTSLRKRNKQFGRDIITEAKAVSAEEAFKLKAIDILAQSKSDFLSQANNRSVDMLEGKALKVQPGEIVRFELDTRFELLSFLSDPQVAYLLFLGSLALLYFEFTNPGTLIAGVTGGLGLILSLIALHKLNVEWGGVLLILLGMSLIIAEMFIPSFGALGIGGMAAFVVGSIFLFDPAKTGGYTLPMSTILIATIIFAALFFGIGYLVVKTFRIKRAQGMDELVDAKAKVTVVNPDQTSGFVEYKGEVWAFESDTPVEAGMSVVITGYEGLKLKIKKEVKGV